MATYHFDEPVHVSVGSYDRDFPAGQVTATSDTEEEVLAGLAGRGYATLVDVAPPAPEVVPEPAAEPPGGED